MGFGENGIKQKGADHIAHQAAWLTCGDVRGMNLAGGVSEGG